MSSNSNETAKGASLSDGELERMFRVEKFDHPDLVGGLVWTDCELRWINERITLAILADREACVNVIEGMPTETGWIGKKEAIRKLRKRSNV